jgi:hypothetical protein
MIEKNEGYVSGIKRKQKERLTRFYEQYLTMTTLQGQPANISAELSI